MIETTLSSEVIELASGHTAQATLEVRNTSLIDDRFSVSLQPTNRPDTENIDPAWFQITPASFPLRPAPAGSSVGGNSGVGDNQQTIELVVVVATSVQAGTYTGLIEIKARSGPDNSASLPFSIIIPEIEQQTLELQPVEKASARRTEFYRLKLKNAGNAPHLYILYAEDLENECVIRITPGEIELGPGEETALNLKIRPRRRNWIGDDKTYKFTLVLEGFSQETSGQFVQRCALPLVRWFGQHWRRILLAGMVVGVLLIGLLTLFVLNTKSADAIADCGPKATRQVQVISNDRKTIISVSGPHGESPFQEIEENAERFPGMFESLVSVSPDGRRLAYVTAKNEALDDATIVIVELSSRQKILLVPVSSGLWPTRPVWSPNGEKLAYFQLASSSPDQSAALTTVGAIAATSVSTPTPATTITSSNANDPLGLDIKVMEVSQPYVVKQSVAAKQTNLKTDMFYGDDKDIVCWNTESNNLIIRSKFNNATQTQIKYPDGTPGPAVARPTPQPTIPGETPLSSPTVTGPVASASAGTQRNTSLSQLDPRWRDTLLNQIGTARVSEYGSAIIASAIALNYTGDQLKLNDECLKKLSVSPLRPEGWQTMINDCLASQTPSQRFERTDFCWTRLNAALNKGPAIVGLLGGQTGRHFVAVNTSSGDIANKYTVSDPWDGSTYKTLDYFLSVGYRLKWFVGDEDSANLPCNDDQQLSDNKELKSIEGSTKNLVNGGLYKLSDYTGFQYDASNFITASYRSVNTPSNTYSQVKPLKIQSGKLISLSNDGIYQLSATHSDQVSRPNQISTPNLQFIVDSNGPEMLLPVFSKGSDPKTNSYQTPVTVTLKAVDTLSGVANIKYCIESKPTSSKDISQSTTNTSKPCDNSNTTGWQDYISDTTSSPIQLGEPKEYIIYWKATDGAGNESSSKVITVSVEAPKPTQPFTNTPITPATITTATATTKSATTTAATTKSATTTTVTTKSATTTAATTTAATTKSATTTAATTNPPSSSAATTRPPSPTVPPSSTPIPNARLTLATSNLVFDPKSTSLSLTLFNTGSVGDVKWTLQTNGSEGLLNFSDSTGSIKPNDKKILTVSLKALDLNSSDQATSFQINSDAGNQFVQVKISKQQLPTAFFTAPVPPAGQLDTFTVTGQLSVTTYTKAQPDHAVITATYKTAPTSDTTTDQRIARLTATDNWAFAWDTAEVIPQNNSISLRGVLCATPDESACTPIPPINGLSIVYDAAFSSPNSSTNVLPDLASVVVTPTGHARYVTLSYSYSNSDAENTIEVSPSITNNWSVVWATKNIIPTAATRFTLRGKVCFNAANCKPITALSGLQTVMTATVSANQSLDTGVSLAPGLSFTVSQPSANINHVSLYADYQELYNGSFVGSHRLPVQTSPLTASPLSWQLSWDATGLPPQNALKLELRACYTADESICTTLGKPYTGLQVANKLPYTLSFYDSYCYYSSDLNSINTCSIQARNSSVPFSLTVKVRDANGYPVSQVPVSYTIYGNGNASGGFSTIGCPSTGGDTAPIPTNAFGSAAPPPFCGRGVTSSLYSVKASITNADPLTFLLYNRPNPSNADFKIYNSSSSYTVNTLFYLYPYVSFSGSVPTNGFGNPTLYSCYTPVSGPGATTAVPCTNISINIKYSGYNYASSPVTVATNKVAGQYAILKAPDTSGLPTLYTAPVDPAFLFLRNLPDVPYNTDFLPGTDTQFGLVGQKFAKRLRVNIKDQSNNQINSYNNVSVSYSIIPGPNGAGATFDNGSTNGLTASPGYTLDSSEHYVAYYPLKANGVAGDFTVQMDIFVNGVVQTKLRKTITLHNIASP